MFLLLNLHRNIVFITLTKRPIIYFVEKRFIYKKTWKLNNKQVLSHYRKDKFCPSIRLKENGLRIYGILI